MSDAGDMAGRVRAARSYAGLEQVELVDKVAGAISIATLRRIESKSTQRIPTYEERSAIADACGVPLWFLERGWDGWRHEQAATSESAELAKLRDAIADATAEFKRAARAAGVSSPTLAGAAEEVAGAVEEAAAAVPRTRGRSSRAS